MMPPSPLVAALLLTVSSRVYALRWLGMATKEVYGTVGSRGTQRWAKGGGLGLQAASVGVVVAHGGVGRWRGYLGHRHSPNRAPIAS